MAKEQHKQKRKYRTRDEKLDNYKLVLDWRSQKPPVTWREIAERLTERNGKHICHQDVWAWYYKIRDDDNQRLREKVIKKQAADILWMLDELEEAWEASKGKIIKRKVKVKPDAKSDPEGNVKGKPIEIETSEEVSHGDVAYLETRRRLYERLSKLTGGDAPVKIAKTDNEGNDLPEVPAIVVLPSNGRDATPPKPARKKGK